MLDLNGDILVFGEALFDKFEDGRLVLGGAPLNVAWNLKGLGLDPILVTALGNDELGRKAFETIKQWGLSTEGVQIVKGKPTGVVNVIKTSNEHRFEIPSEMASDYIDREIAMTALQFRDISLIYNGSLVLRGQASMETLWFLRNISKAKLIIDANLRPPWVVYEDLFEAMRKADIIKLSRYELGRLFNIDCANESNIEMIGRSLMEHISVDTLIITLAEQGAYIMDRETSWKKIAPELEGEFIDSVGCGDGFVSMFIAARIYGLSVDSALSKGLNFATQICTIKGAVTEDKSFYDRFTIDSVI